MLGSSRGAEQLGNDCKSCKGDCWEGNSCDIWIEKEKKGI